MTLSRNQYQAFEDIVGADNISDEPAILDSYCFEHRAEMNQPDYSQFFPRAEAVILPGSTEEVQAIVRTCNRYHLKFKAHCTGYGPYGMPPIKGVIALDMRRMNKIEQIDEQNKIAVVQPYVTAVQLQAEVMKVGLNCHMIGAGSISSVLATAACFLGNGPDSIANGCSGENLLSLEWVMPTGEIMRTGSLGSGDGWFCGEGPGPSTRGMMRGHLGSRGGFGVVTRCAIRLHPWAGPTVMPVEGTIPAYMSPLPDNFKAYTIAFPTWQAYADAHNLMYDAEIGYVVHRQFIQWGAALQAAFMKIYIDPTRTIDSLEEEIEKPETKELTEELRISFQVVMVGNSMRDIDYQEKALDEILAETKGWKVAGMSTPEMQKWQLLYLLRLPIKNLNFVWGTYANSFSQAGTPDFLISTVHTYQALKDKYIKSGGLTDDGGDAQMGPLSNFGGGGVTMLEGFAHYDQTNADSIKQTKEYVRESVKVSLQHGWHPGLGGIIGIGGSKEDLKEAFAAVPQPSIYDWQCKIKQAFDPNDTSGDPSFGFHFKA